MLRPLLMELNESKVSSSQSRESINLLFEEAKKDTKACHSQMQQRYLAFISQKKRDYK